MQVIKVSEASEAALDWLVAKCEGEGIRVEGGKVRFALSQFTDDCDLYSPSTDWGQGGPIINQLMAQGAEMRQGGPSAGNQRCWFKLDTQILYSHGPTPLVAAMRGYVASKLGDTVEVPEELIG